MNPNPIRIAIGLHACREALHIRPQKVRKAFLKKDWAQQQELKELQALIKSFKIPMELQAAQQLDHLGSHHQGIALEITETPEPNWHELQKLPRQLYVALDGIEDPHNLGAIIRSSWLLGVHTIFSLKNRAVGLTPTVHKAASGGVEHVPVEFVANFQSPLEWLKEQGVFVIGLSEKGSQSLFSLKIPDKVLWVLGAEGKGIRKTTLQLCDELVFIPQTADHHSFNASVALAIALSETWRQHHLQ